MHLYDARLGEFIHEATSGQIAKLLSERFLHKLEIHAGESERTSWRNSLGAFAVAMTDRAMDDSWLVLEYQLPRSSARVDCMVIGSDERERQNAVILEFKQWDTCVPSETPSLIQMGGRLTLHPSAQASAYADYLADAHSAFVDGRLGLHSAAFLHNADSRAGGSAFRVPCYEEYTSDSPLFTRDMVDSLASYLYRRAGRPAHEDSVAAVLQGQYKPSKALLTHVAEAIEGHEPWHLLDNQLVVFEEIMDDVRRARTTGRKRVIIVTGGPGTGKSIIAAQVVGAAAKEGFAVSHATGSKAFTTNMKGIVGAKAAAVFTYTSSFKNESLNSQDLVVVDEAHRLREKTEFRGRVMSDVPQWEQITQAAKVAVYFLDPQQSVRLNEKGSPDVIDMDAAAKGIPTVHYPLDIQFRCAGSESYIRWVEYFLGLSEESSLAWRRNREYEVVVHDRIEELERAVRQHNVGESSARLVAGFCWSWSAPLPDGSLVPDVTVGDWSMPWNRKPPEMIGGSNRTLPPHLHPYTIWARYPQGVNEIGCIYSAQGFEFDYIGVIVGRDLLWDPNRRAWKPNLAASKDSAFKRGISGKDKEALAIQQLAQVYRVLFTRGMKGAHFYFLDPATRHRFLELLGG